jgi:hypothetical protein
MNILMVTLAYDPAIAFGGPVKVVQNNARELVRRGHHVTVYCTNLSSSVMVLTHPSTCSLSAPADAGEAGALAHAATAPAKTVTGVWPRRRYP